MDAQNPEMKEAARQARRKADMKKVAACRDEIKAVLKKYNAMLAYDLHSSYGKDHGFVKLKKVDDIPGAEIPITLYDWRW